MKEYSEKFKEIVRFVRETFKTDEFIPLHEPRFQGNEKKYVNECIDTTFVSSVGKYVDRFEEMTAKYCGAKYAVAVGNGTAALHVTLMLAGVTENDEVITQPLTFVATANAISYLRAQPVFVDVDLDTLGISPSKLNEFFEKRTEIRNDGFCYNKITNRKISACLPMHTFGNPLRIKEIVEICEKNNVIVIEDAAESIGSKVEGKHSGTFGLLGILSFNGNKIITTGGGGMIITDNKKLAATAKHLTTTAKIPHKWEYVHDMIGFNYRLPNINAALGCAQLEGIDKYLKNKKELFDLYKNFLEKIDVQFVKPIGGTVSNHWLNAIILKNFDERNSFLEYTNLKAVMTRPIWRLLHKLEMFKDSHVENIENAEWLEKRVVNIPSSVRL
ncbi:MAG: LegC family aminotransferase [Bacteroidota bacterium]|nr:LegC family aminotransferase [Bacteroidota bacterium]